MLLEKRKRLVNEGTQIKSATLPKGCSFRSCNEKADEAFLALCIQAQKDESLVTCG
ncbi:hypothetical protein NCCP133_05980 [Cytobacillus sp. NCCP-133]|nr:hypothetical protein NCCP133_05980 [Cytobacillus sp. NCCP-133]